MTIADESLVRLRIIGDDLVPGEITALLECEPDTAHTKGDVWKGPKTGTTRTRRTGCWSIGAARREPEKVVAQISEILDRLPQDLTLWRRHGEKYALDFFCGVFMSSPNIDLGFSPDIMQRLSDRGITLSLDIYVSCDE